MGVDEIETDVLVERDVVRAGVEPNQLATQSTSLFPTSRKHRRPVTELLSFRQHAKAADVAGSCAKEDLSACNRATRHAPQQMRMSRQIGFDDERIDNVLRHAEGRRIDETELRQIGRRLDVEQRLLPLRRCDQGGQLVHNRKRREVVPAAFADDHLRIVSARTAPANRLVHSGGIRVGDQRRDLHAPRLVNTEPYDDEPGDLFDEPARCTVTERPKPIGISSSNEVGNAHTSWLIASAAKSSERYEIDQWKSVIGRGGSPRTVRACRR